MYQVAGAVARGWRHQGDARRLVVFETQGEITQGVDPGQDGGWIGHGLRVRWLDSDCVKQGWIAAGCLTGAAGFRWLAMAPPWGLRW